MAREVESIHKLFQDQFIIPRVIFRCRDNTAKAQPVGRKISASTHRLQPTQHTSKNTYRRDDKTPMMASRRRSRNEIEEEEEVFPHSPSTQSTSQSSEVITLFNAFLIRRYPHDKRNDKGRPDALTTLIRERRLKLTRGSHLQIVMMKILKIKLRLKRLNE
jgi:hypothetical protein